MARPAAMSLCPFEVRMGWRVSLTDAVDGSRTRLRRRAQGRNVRLLHRTRQLGMKRVPDILQQIGQRQLGLPPRARRKLKYRGTRAIVNAPATASRSRARALRLTASVRRSSVETENPPIQEAAIVQRLAGLQVMPVHRGTCQRPDEWRLDTLRWISKQFCQ